MRARRREDTKLIKAKDGSMVRERLHPRDSEMRNQSLAEALISPNERNNSHYHKKSEEIYYILKGTGEVRIDEEVINVNEGDTIPIPPGSVHSIENKSDRDLIILCCSSPAYKDEDTYLT